MNLIPPALAPGDMVAVAAPAGYPRDYALYESGCATIRSMGFSLYEEHKRWPGDGYLSDTDEKRLEELVRVWSDPRVKAVLSLRGGYGALRLLKTLDVEFLRQNPKLLVGFSDISILLNYFYQKTGLISLHGPVLTTLGSLNSGALERFYYCLRGQWNKTLHENIEVIRSGPKACGPLLGGNLSSLVTLMGTPWAIDFTGAIVVLEDVNEPHYRLDRLLTQFFSISTAQRVAGIILGSFSDDRDSNSLESLRRVEFVWNRVCELHAETSVPIWGNFPAGHTPDNVTVPIGCSAVMDSSAGTLSFSPQQHED